MDTLNRPIESTEELRNTGRGIAQPAVTMGVCYSHAGGVKVRRLGHWPFIIGHDPKCDIVLPGPFVSRRHCRLRPEGGRIFVEDLDSRNGTWIDDVRVDGVQSVSGTARLTVGDQTLTLLEALSWNDKKTVWVFADMAAGSAQSLHLFHRINRIAALDDPVLITGPTGTGKELVAKALHARNPARAGAPLVALNCGSLPESLISAELFGCTRGAFTGAQHSRIGAFRSADRGSLFLDEVGEIPPESQAVLLRVLESGEVRPLGADRLWRPNVRVISATNRCLDPERFSSPLRPDLYFRLAILGIELRPLYQRPADIAAISRYIVWRDTQGTRCLTSEAEKRLVREPWPGNIRQLRNILRRTLVETANPRISATDLQLPQNPPEKQTDPAPVESAWHGVREQMLRATLDRQQGDRRATCNALGIPRSTLYYHLKRQNQSQDIAEEDDALADVGE